MLCPTCGRELVDAKRDPLIGGEVGNHRITARLGVGGMGAVYAGIEKTIDKKVAIKIVHPHLSASTELPTLLAEAKAVNAIGDRGIVDVHGFGALPDGRQYLVMELLEGEGLDHLLRRKPRLSLDELLWLGDGLLSSLEAAHAAGFVHRDIKPGNVFVVRPKRGEPYLKLLDFGLAQRARTRNRLVLGTPAYVAPEQAKPQAAVGPAADLYAVGCVLFEAATGRMPFDDPSAQRVLELHALADRPSARKLRPELPPALDALITSLMAIDVEARPKTAGAARAALKALAPRRRSRAPLVALTAALLAVAGSVTWVLTRPEPPTLVTVSADPLEAAVARASGEVRHALDAKAWQAALEALAAGERSFPGRREWQALRGEARAAVRRATTEALSRDDFAAARALAALDPPPEDDVAAALAREELARKTGMVRVAGVWIDAYEHPNRAGAVPTVKVDWTDAQKLCAAAGKRLCTEDEWQRACTGAPARGRCHRRGKLKAAMPTGAMEGCVTAEGVHDLIGNVAEWTASPIREGAPQRVIRGGSFAQGDAKLACDARDYYLPGQGGAKHIGVRCCL